MMMSATVCPTSEKLRALTLGQLSTDESDDLVEHLGSRESCRIDLETVKDVEDSLIASLRDPDEFANFDAEPDCQVAMAKALGALANVGQSEFSPSAPTNFPSRIGAKSFDR